MLLNSKKKKNVKHVLTYIIQMLQLNKKNNEQKLSIDHNVQSVSPPPQAGHSVVPPAVLLPSAPGIGSRSLD